MQKKQTVDNPKIFSFNFMIILEVDKKIVMQRISNAQAALDTPSLLYHDDDDGLDTVT